MKTIKFILLSSLAMIIFSGCNDTKQFIDDSQPPELNNLQLSFIDNSGTDRVKGLSSGNYMCYAINPDGSKDDKSLSVILNEGIHMLFAHTYAGKNQPQPNVLTYKLACSHIFGTGELHTIVSHWERETERTVICTKVTFDGKEVPVTKNQHGYQPVAHITLDN